MNNLKLLFDVVIMTIQSRSKAVKHLPYFFLPSSICAAVIFLDDNGCEKVVVKEGPGENVLSLLSSSELVWSLKARRELFFLFFQQIFISFRFWKAMSIGAQCPSQHKVRLWNGCCSTQQPLFYS